MSQKTIILFLVLFSLIVSGMFVYANLRKGELQERATTNQVLE